MASEVASADAVLPKLHAAILHSPQEISELLWSYGVPRHRARAIEALGNVVLEAGLILVIRGGLARQVVRDWASAIGHNAVVFDSTIGLFETAPVAGMLSAVPTRDALAMLDANLSALDIYARPILDLVVSRLVVPGKDASPAILMAASESLGGLPVPKTFEMVSVVVNLEMTSALRNISELEDLKLLATNPEDGFLYSQLCRPAADRLRSYLDRLSDDACAMVLSLLAEGRS